MFSAAILDGNIVAKSKGLTPINLQSVAIGNGMISAFSMFPTQYDMVCTSVSLPPLMSIAECIEMKRGVSSFVTDFLVLVLIKWDNPDASLFETDPRRLRRPTRCNRMPCCCDVLFRTSQRNCRVW